jgi:5,10-methylenetetrahydromethanopterin reductase
VTSAVRTGIWLYPDAPARALVDAVVAADAGGVDEVWIADEGVAREPVPLLAAAAARTRHTLLGVGITSPLLRHPGAVAASVATLDELSGGRAVLGFGVGGEQSLEPFGIEARRPVALVRDAIRTAHAVLRGTAASGYAPPLHASPPRDVPVFVGAKGEQLNRLASREADGVFLSGFALDRLDTAVGWARSVRPVHVAVYASVRFDPGAAEDPTALRGSPAAVAAGLAQLAARLEPDSVGLALVDGRTPVEHVERALDALARFRDG